jgi:low temperature requirement protein LtrA
VLVTLLGSLTLAAALPQTFGGDGLIFAGAYIFIQAGRYIFLLLILHGHQLRGVVVRSLWSSGVSTAPWLAGAFTHGIVRSGLWAVAIVSEYAVFALNLPLPWAGHMGPWEPPTSAEHLAERYRQFFIIALGELILASGLTFDNDRFASSQLGAFAVSVVTTALLWRVYIFRAGEDLPAAFRVASTPARLGIGVVYAHLGMIAGIIVTAVGDELLIAGPFESASFAPGMVILGGPAIFLASRTAFGYTVFTKFYWHCLAGALVLVAVGLLMLPMPRLVAAIIAAVVVLAVAILDATSVIARLHAA